MKRNVFLCVSVQVDTDLEGVDNIVDNLDVSINPISENVEIDKWGIVSFHEE